MKELPLNGKADELIASSDPVLVAFIKRNSQFQSQLETLTRASRTLDAKVDVYFLGESYLDAGMKRFMVTGTPTYLLFNKGWEVDRLMGVTDPDTLDDFVNKALSKKHHG